MIILGKKTNIPSAALLETLNIFVADTLQALVQYGDALAAQAAKMTLDGQHIYNSCCTLRIEYSKLQQLNVKYNNDKSRDFTNPSLPTGDPTIDNLGLPNPLGMLHSPFANLGSHLTAAFNPPTLPLGGFALPAAQALGVASLRLPGTPQSCVLLVSNLNEQVRFSQFMSVYLSLSFSLSISLSPYVSLSVSVSRSRSSVPSIEQSLDRGSNHRFGQSVTRLISRPTDDGYTVWLIAIDSSDLSCR